MFQSLRRILYVREVVLGEMFVSYSLLSYLKVAKISPPPQVKSLIQKWYNEFEYSSRY